MHTEMWEHPATRANVATLRARGAHIVPPAVRPADRRGHRPRPAARAGGDLRRLPRLLALPARGGRLVRRRVGNWARRRVEAGKPLAGRRVVVSAGGTREPLDPVRYLGNRSSGKQGYALAQVAAARGATVTLVAANTSLPAPTGVDVVPVGTALELQDAVTQAAKDADVVVMAAAVADFRPGLRGGQDQEVPRRHVDGGPDESAPTIELVRNPDILAGLVEDRGAADRPLIVGFAAETGDDDGWVLDHARAKLARKGCDLLVVNEVGADKAFGTDDNTVHLLFRDGLPGARRTTWPGPAPKAQIAAAVWDAVQALLDPR